MEQVKSTHTREGKAHKKKEKGKRSILSVTTRTNSNRSVRVFLYPNDGVGSDDDADDDREERG